MVLVSHEVEPPRIPIRPRYMSFSHWFLDSSRETPKKKAYESGWKAIFKILTQPIPTPVPLLSTTPADPLADVAQAAAPAYRNNHQLFDDDEEMLMKAPRGVPWGLGGWEEMRLWPGNGFFSNTG